MVRPSPAVATILQRIARANRSGSDPGFQRGAGAGGADRAGEGRDVVRAVVAAAVHEERRRPRDAGEVGAVHVLGDPGAADALTQVLGEAVGVQAELLSIADHLRGLGRTLV